MSRACQVRAWEAVIGGGANLGARHATLTFAARLLHARGVTVLRSAPRYASEAWVPPGAPPGPAFVNTAWRVRAVGSPEQLLEVLLGVERALGRTRTTRWAARTLDLDLLVAFDPEGRPRAQSTRRLELPHPGLRERPFALAPALDVAPELAALRRDLAAPPPRALTLDAQDRRAREDARRFVRGTRLRAVVACEGPPPEGFVVAACTRHGEVVRYGGVWSRTPA